MSALSTLGETYDGVHGNPEYVRKLDNFWDEVGDTPIKTLIRIASNNFPKDSLLTLADLGCGTGRDLLMFPKLLVQAGFSKTKCVGCETSSVAVEKCKQRGLAVAHADTESFLNGFDEPFSILWSHYSMIHLKADELNPAISLLASKLAPSGILAVGFKAGDGSCLPDAGYGATRETTYFKFDLIADLVQQNGLGIQASISIPSSGRSVPHQYAWIIASKL